MKEYKGMRTVTPREHKQLTRILNGWIAAGEAYGFQQYKTPILDPAELYEDKTSEEIVREQTYRFTDRAGRDVILRPEITPGVSRMMVDLQKHRVIRSPYKVFSIGSVFRYEKPQHGRTREHIQFNVDIFGESSAWAESEVIEIACDSLKRIGFRCEDFVVRLNDRHAVEKTLIDVGISGNMLPDVLRLFDRRKKMAVATFSREMKKITNISLDTIDKAMLHPTQRVQEVVNLLPEGIAAEYDPSVIRGFDYYTGIIFEIFTKDKKIASRSVAGGGRYDRLIESYGGSPLPAVGFGMGDIVLADCLEKIGSEDALPTTPVIVCATSEHATAYAQNLCRIMRSDFVDRKTDTHFPVSFIGTVPEKKLTDRYKRCEKDGVQYVIAADEQGNISARILASRKTKKSKTLGVIMRYIQKKKP